MDTSCSSIVKSPCKQHIHAPPNVQDSLSSLGTQKNTLSSSTKLIKTGEFVQ